MSANLFLDGQFVRAEIGRLIDLYPDLAEDETLRTDMIEGETNAIRIIERALSERQDAETMAGAIKAREIDMAARRSRFERKSDAMKSLILNIMRAAELDKLPLPEASLFITKPRQSVNVIDVDELPQGFFKTVRQADKTALKSALEKGEQVPGAELAMGKEGLTIRTK